MPAAFVTGLLAAGLSAAPSAQSPRETAPRDTAPGRVAPISQPADADASLPPIDGPPPPLAPEVIARDADGRATVRAVRLAQRIALDGRLDEDVYDLIPPVGGFVQQVPDPGAPATEPTEAWVMFDGANLYVAARCYDSAPPGAWVANDMRRDTPQLRQNDTFAVILDTFYDRRNGVAFYTNPLGARADFAITNEGSPNSDWNPIWDVRVGRFEGGWTVEMEIPFKSLRYRSGEAQVWGFQLRRVVRRKNEGSYLTPLPISAVRGSAIRGIFRVSDAATLVGLEAPQDSRTFEIKPYAIGGVTTTVDAVADRDNVGARDAGLDVKLGITQNLTADFTLNTDFAQVEVDEQQVNLTRFSLFFPEKREFFLEGRGIFEFARGPAGGRSAGFRDQDAPILFYSRRIGLEDGQVVPIRGGARVTGKTGAFDVGMLNIQTGDLQAGDDPNSVLAATNFTVVRLKRDLLRKSSVGALLTNRSVATAGDGSSQTFGVDGTFAFYDSLSFIGSYAETRKPGVSGEDASYQGEVLYDGDRYGFQANHMLVGNNFDPEVGYRRRFNFRRTFGSARFSPRPTAIDAVRQFNIEAGIDNILTADTGLLETRLNRLQFGTELENSDLLRVAFTDNYERLDEPFSPGEDLTIPIGGYDFQDVEVSYQLGQQHRANGMVSVRRGGYFGGNITSLDFNRGYVEITQQLAVEPSVSFNWIDVPQGASRTDLYRARANYAFSPWMFFSGLVQYNTADDALSSNLRFRWEYSPGSELFIVYTEERDTDPLRPTRIGELRNRGFVVKINRLFRL